MNINNEYIVGIKRWMCSYKKIILSKLFVKHEQDINYIKKKNLNLKKRTFTLNVLENHKYEMYIFILLCGNICFKIITK